MQIESKYIYFTLATVDDAQFIYDLRKERGEYLHATETLEDQIAFLKRYKEKEKQQQEFYFVIHDKKTAESLGCVRIYDINREKSTCEWGSWILKKNISPFISIFSALMIYECAFNHLNIATCLLNVRLENQKVIYFHKKTGAKYLNETDLEMYFSYDKPTFENALKKYHKFVGEIKVTE